MEGAILDLLRDAAGLDSRPDPSAELDTLGFDSLDTIDLAFRAEDAGLQLPDDWAQRCRTVGDVMRVAVPV